MQNTRNIAVACRPLDRHLDESISPTSPPKLERPSLIARDVVSALYSKALDLWKCPRGVIAARSLIHSWISEDGAHVDKADELVSQYLEIFNDKLEAMSPLLLIDEVFDSPHLIGMHCRGYWVGEPEDFDPRMQVLKINAEWIALVVEAEAACIANSTASSATSYWLAEFRIIWMMVHELAHLLGTYLGHGNALKTSQTPSVYCEKLHPRDSCWSVVSCDDKLRSSTEDVAMRGQSEAGDLMEHFLFGGLIEFADDGCPWVCIGENEARKVDSAGVRRLMQGEVPLELGEPLLHLTERTMDARCRPNERPQLANAPRFHGTVMCARARSEQPDLIFSDWHRHPGCDQSLDRLREIIARRRDLGS